MSFINEKVQPEGLTFDDVLLVPAYSEVLPREVSVVTRFSRNIQLNIPIVSAAMDTVTEAPLAIALAREGGIGVIHKNMSIAEQAAHVRKVKRAENGMIYDPITISKDDTVGDALALMKENKIGGGPPGGGSAFKGCTNLTTVNIADGVEYIEAGAFNGCTALTDITIPDSVGYIKTGAFKDCSALTSVTIRDDCRLDMNVFPTTVEVNHSEG